jgi:hypothetical protein
MVFSVSIRSQNPRLVSDWSQEFRSIFTSFQSLAYVDRLLRYLDTVEVTDSSSVRPTIFNHLRFPVATRFHAGLRWVSVLAHILLRDIANF